MNDINITSKDLIDMNRFPLPTKAKEFSNDSFWYYTRLSTADLILKNKCIYISNFSGMNDVDEAELHKEDSDFIHCLCLCNSNTEKIPMWYLYSGISGQGVSLGFTPLVMLNFIKSINTVTTPDGKITLHKDDDFDINYGWVFYRKKEANSQVMYKRKWYSLNDPKNFEKNNYFIKSYPWEYEKEFRIVIHNKTNTPYDKLVLNIEPIYNQIKLKLAPELSNEMFKKILPTLSGFSGFLFENLLHSKLSINMNLCERNFEGFIDYIKTSSTTATDSQKLDYNKICEAISNNCKHKGE